MPSPTLEEIFALLDQRLTDLAQQTQAETFGASERVTLKLVQLYYLHAVQERGQTTLTELATRFHVSKPSATVAVKKLVAMGYLEKHQSEEDLRVFYIQLTEKGRRVLNLKERTFHSFAEQIRMHLTQPETAELERLLRKALESTFSQPPEP
jgi:MarR family transcriptional regulator, organic hydroperoxide resistance regulator